MIFVIRSDNTKCWAPPDLTDEGDDPDYVVDGVGEQSHQDVPLAVYFPGIDLVEEGHHDKRVEYHREMLRWR